MNTSGKINIYILALAILVAILMLASSFVFLDIWNNKLAEVDKLNLDLTSLQSAHQEMNSISQVIKNTQEERIRLNNYFITQETTPYFIEEIESLAAEMNVVPKLRTLSLVKDGKTADSPEYLKLDLQVEGSYTNVFHFLRSLEKMPYRVRFNSVGIIHNETEATAGANNVSPWRGEFTFDLLSYVNK